MQVRRRVNALDNLTTGKAVDALLNYETVKLFNNEQLEVDNYDAYLVGYQKAAVATENVSAKLNAGQVQSTLLFRKPEPEMHLGASSSQLVICAQFCTHK